MRLIGIHDTEFRVINIERKERCTECNENITGKIIRQTIYEEHRDNLTYFMCLECGFNEFKFRLEDMEDYLEDGKNDYKKMIKRWSKHLALKKLDT